MSIQPSTIRITRRYADDSGVECEVSYFQDDPQELDGVHVKRHGNTAVFDLVQVEWLIDALRYITYQVKP